MNRDSLCGIWRVIYFPCCFKKNLSKRIASMSMKKSEFNCIMSSRIGLYLVSESVCMCVAQFPQLKLVIAVAFNSDCPNILLLLLLFLHSATFTIYLFDSIHFITRLFLVSFWLKNSKTNCELVVHRRGNIKSVILCKIENHSI